MRTGGVDARVPWLPLSNQPINSKLNKTEFLNSTKIYDNSLTLPIYNSMTDKEMKFVLNISQNV